MKDKVNRLVLSSFLVYSYVYCIAFVLMYSLLSYFSDDAHLNVWQLAWDCLISPVYMMKLGGYHFLLLLIPIMYYPLVRTKFLDTYTSFVVTVIVVALLNYLSIWCFGVERLEVNYTKWAYNIHKIYYIIASLLVALTFTRFIVFREKEEIEDEKEVV